MKRFALFVLTMAAALPARADDSVPFGATSVKLQMVIRDSSTGALKTGILFNTSGLIISARADNAAAATVYSVASSNVEDITTLGTYAAPSSNAKIRFKQVDSTNQPGVYELQPHNDLFSTANARTLTFGIVGTGITADPLRVVLTDSVPNVNCQSLSDNAITSSKIAANAITATAIASDAITAAKIAADAIGGSELATDAATEVATSVWANGTRSLTDKAGFSLSQAFPTNFASLAITGGGAVTAGTVSDKTGYSLSGTQTFNLTGNITGNLSGSVGSVTALGNDALDAADITAAAANKIADHVLRRTTANVEASSNGDTLSRKSLYGGTARLTHRVQNSAGTLKTYKADGTTVLDSQTVSTDPGAQPIIELQ